MGAEAEATLGIAAQALSIPIFTNHRTIGTNTRTLGPHAHTPPTPRDRIAYTITADINQFGPETARAHAAARTGRELADE